MLWKRLKANQASAAQPKFKSRICLQPAPILLGLLNRINPDTILSVILSCEKPSCTREFKNDILQEPCLNLMFASYYEVL